MSTALAHDLVSDSSMGEAMHRVLLGVGGGIAAYKSCEIIRRLKGSGLAPAVTVVPTASALKFVGAATFEALSGLPVTTDVFSDVPSVAHVAIGQQADLVVVAPATADLLSRMAAGRADDLLTASLLVTRSPVLVVPAMHSEMWTHPATRANVAALRSRDVIVLDPAVGRLTGADSGPGRLPEPEHIAALAELLLLRPAALPRDLAGSRVVISAGGTREALDPVRFLGNRSSGRQGFALALVAAARGAQVTLVAANTDLSAPPGVTMVPVGSAVELEHEVTRATFDAAAPADAVIMAAAVADFRPSLRRDAKIKKTSADKPDVVALTQNPDILTGLVERRVADGAKVPVIVGFAAETGDDDGDVLGYGREKLARKGCDALVVNDVSGGGAFGSLDNAAQIISADRPDINVTRGPKSVLAAAVCDVISDRLALR